LGASPSCQSTHSRIGVPTTFLNAVDGSATLEPRASPVLPVACRYTAWFFCSATSRFHSGRGREPAGLDQQAPRAGADSALALASQSSQGPGRTRPRLDLEASTSSGCAGEARQFACAASGLRHETAARSTGPGVVIRGSARTGPPGAAHLALHPCLQRRERRENPRSPGRTQKRTKRRDSSIWGLNPVPGLPVRRGSVFALGALYCCQRGRALWGALSPSPPRPRGLGSPFPTALTTP
jgi:hypothetical protein